MSIKEKIKRTLKSIRRIGLKNKDFTIISNNCWAGASVYKYYGLQYKTPTCGLFLFSHDFIQFVKDLKAHLDAEITEIHFKDSKYQKELVEKLRGGEKMPNQLLLGNA